MQEWVLYACAILILTSIFHMLTPDGAIKGTMRFVLNLFLIGLIITPIFKSLSSSKIQPYLNSKQIESNNNQQINQKQNEIKIKNLENAITILLKNNNFKNFKINLNFEEQTQKTKIKIIFKENEQPDKTKLNELIKKETGLTPEIITK